MGFALIQNCKGECRRPSTSPEVGCTTRDRSPRLTTLSFVFDKGAAAIASLRPVTSAFDQHILPPHPVESLKSVGPCRPARQLCGFTDGSDFHIGGHDRHNIFFGILVISHRLPDIITDSKPQLLLQAGLRAVEAQSAVTCK